MSLPYEGAQSGDRALADIQKILQRFGCQSFGHMMNYEKRELIVQFRYRNRPVAVRASVNGYAAAWLKEHPWSARMRRSKSQHEQEAVRIATLASYSMLRDWVKGQVTAVECGILTFEGAFLGQLLLPNGRSMLEQIEAQHLLEAPA